MMWRTMSVGFDLIITLVRQCGAVWKPFAMSLASKSRGYDTGLNGGKLLTTVSRLVMPYSGVDRLRRANPKPFG